MIQYNKKVIARPGYFLEFDSKKNIITEYDDNIEYTEYAIPDNITKITCDVYNVGDILNVQINDEVNTKAVLVNMLWSNDDQIAIMLNKDNSEETEETFNYMQGWRDYFSKIIKQCKRLN